MIGLRVLIPEDLATLTVDTRADYTVPAGTQGVVTNVVGEWCDVMLDGDRVHVWVAHDTELTFLHETPPDLTRPTVEKWLETP